MSQAHMGATPGFFSETTSAALTTKIMSHKPNTRFFKTSRVFGLQCGDHQGHF